MSLHLFAIDPAQQLRSIVFVEPDELSGDRILVDSRRRILGGSYDPRRQDETERARQFKMADDLFVLFEIVIRLELDASGG
jgi:hypothetical protein